MSETYNLLFDLDDTLIHCNKYFDAVIEQFADLMETWFAGYRLAKEDIKRKQLELDLAGIDVHGFTAERFPESFAETYDHYSAVCGRETDPDERRRLLELGYTVFDSEFELYPDVVETLGRLQAEGHSLSLYTGGVPDIQRRKVEKVNLSPFFGERIFVAQHKNRDALERVLLETGFDRSRTWMIGNSLRTDINPAIECGIGAVYIPPLSNWAFDLVDIPVASSARLLRLDSIREVPGALEASRQPR